MLPHTLFQKRGFGGFNLWQRLGSQYNCLKILFFGVNKLEGCNRPLAKGGKRVKGKGQEMISFPLLPSLFPYLSKKYNIQIALWGWVQGLGVTCCGAIALFENCAIAQITPDNTLPNNSRVTTQNNIKIIEDGTRVGSNLFHSFQEFSVLAGTSAYFNNPLDIQNIITRVTGKSISNINGALKANGTSNLFLINPNGIIFGAGASLNIGGSFVASTASSLNFADGIKFSATDPQTAPLLTVSVPIGLQFGATAAPIRNQSQASPDGATTMFGYPVGLQVQTNKTLALVGGDITLEGGNLTAAEGRIQLVAVAGNNLVSLNPTNIGWILGYEGVQNFQNIQLIEGTVGGSKIPSFVSTSGQNGSGNIQVRGKSVELIGNFVRLLNLNMGAKDGGDLMITAKKLMIRDGAQVLNATLGEGASGNLIVNASESVEVISSLTNSIDNNPSVLSSATFGNGKAGDLKIDTGILRIQNGAQVTAESSGTVDNSQLTLATGRGGNLTVNASKSVELSGISADGFPSILSARTIGSGDAGRVTITTTELIVRDRGRISTSIEAPNNFIYRGDANKPEKAGELNVTARSIRLDNQGKVTSDTSSGRGGNIKLQVEDLLLMRRNSQISTNAGNAQAGGIGGNITINAPKGFIVADKGENSDITANAFTDSGGRVKINATAIFGIVPRSREDLVSLLGTNDPTKLNPQKLPTSDITAISQTNPTLSGAVSINTVNTDPDRGLINLPAEPSSPKLAQGCKSGVAQNQSQFIITGRGGLPPNPREVLNNNTVQVDWVSVERTGRQGERGRRGQVTGSAPSIVEAQGWIVDTSGNVVLVADKTTKTHYNTGLQPVICPGKSSPE
jgi:filamentous hemagglutinin family protein